MNPRRLGELVQEVIAEIGGDKAIEDLIRKEKACKIDDIFRGAKLAQCHDHRFVQELRDPVAFFDKLYELDLDTLDAYSKALDKKNTAYMQAQVLAHNRGEQNNGFPPINFGF
jgi:hypothetical protein